MNWFEYISTNFILTICPQMLWDKRHRTKRKYILNEIKQNRGIL